MQSKINKKGVLQKLIGDLIPKESLDFAWRFIGCLNIGGDLVPKASPNNFAWRPTRLYHITI